jgi:parallel beta-helix repeat protein
MAISIKEVKNIMENKKRIIMLFIAVSGFFMYLNGVSAVNVNIDNNTWTTNDINSYFTGITVHGLTLSNGDNIIFQAGNYLNLVLSVKNSVNIIAKDTVNFIGKGATIGITVSNANYVNISEMTVSNYTYGIYVSYSNNTGVFNNNASGNSKNGITLDTSSNTAIVNNTAYNNTNRGIYLSSSSNSNVSNNIICNSLGNGGIISATSINSYIFNNTITQNVDGI